jgi:hypothetical protein
MMIFPFNMMKQINPSFAYWADVRAINAAGTVSFKKLKGIAPWSCRNEAEAYSWLLTHAKRMSYTITRHNITRQGEYQSTSKAVVVRTTPEPEEPAPVLGEHVNVTEDIVYAETI